LGETLSERFAVSWASGFWMLYAAGRFVDFVGVIRAYLSELPRDDDLMILGDLLSCVEELTYATCLDRVPELASLHRLAVLDRQAAAQTFEGASRRNHCTTLEAAVYDPRGLRDVDRYEWRQDAKRRWVAFAQLKSGIAEAWVTWNREGRKLTGSMLDGALAIARDSELTVFDREQHAMRLIELTLRKHLLTDDGDEGFPFERPLEHPLDFHIRRLSGRVIPSDLL
jgi:hypothetical protein